MISNAIGIEDEQGGRNEVHYALLAAGDVSKSEKFDATIGGVDKIVPRSDGKVYIEGLVWGGTDAYAGLDAVEELAVSHPDRVTAYAEDGDGERTIGDVRNLDAFVEWSDRPSETVEEDTDAPEKDYQHDPAPSTYHVRRDGAEAVAYSDDGTGSDIARSEQHGDVLQQAFAAMEPDTAIDIEDRVFDCSDVDVLQMGPNPLPSRKYLDQHVRADGTILKGATLRQMKPGIRLSGLKVVGVDGPGIWLTRGHNSVYRECRVTDCDTGFLLGGKNNAMVAFATFENCRATQNRKKGIEMDGSRSNSWVNANKFFGVTVRGNGSDPAHSGIHAYGTANYNVLLGCHSEMNAGRYAIQVEATDWTFGGTHATATGFDSDEQFSLYFGDDPSHSHVVNGGRLPNGIGPDEGVYGGNNRWRGHVVVGGRMKSKDSAD